MYTEREETVLNYLNAYIGKKGYGPTIKEIADACDLTVHHARCALKNLEEVHMINRGKSSRAIGLTQQAKYYISMRE